MKKQKKRRNPPEKAAPAPAVNIQRQEYPVLPWLLVASALVVCLAAASHIRNRVFQTPVTLWRDASSKSVNKRRTHENYGQALSTAGMYDKALQEFNTVLALKDDGSVPMRDVHRERGVVYFRLERIDDAITAWTTGLRYAPFDPSLLNNLSVAYLRQQRFDEAERTIRQALAGAPYMPQALNSLGEILMVKGNYREALTYFLKAIEVSPDAPYRYWNAALAFEKNGKYDKAYEYARMYASMERDASLRNRAVSFMNMLQGRTAAGGK